MAVAAWVRHPWSGVGLLALAAIPGLVVAVRLLILEALNVEQAPPWWRCPSCCWCWAAGCPSSCWSPAVPDD